MTGGVGRRHSSDLALLWMWQWQRPAAAAPIGHLEWESPYAAGETLKSQERKKERKKERNYGFAFCILGWKFQFEIKGKRRVWQESGK